MKTLAIDVGLRNLAFCVIEDKNIVLWENYNLINDQKFCQELTKKREICNKKANYLSNIYTCKTHIPKSTKYKLIKQKKVKNFILQDIAKIVIDKLNEIFTEHKDLFNTLDKIGIELQPKANPKMKLVSHIIFTKLVEACPDCKIIFIGASKKLKCFEKDSRNTYTKRKKLSIEYTKTLLDEEWLNYFESIKTKKDDLADCFLMANNL